MKHQINNYLFKEAKRKPNSKNEHAFRYALDMFKTAQLMMEGMQTMPFSKF